MLVASFGWRKHLGQSLKRYREPFQGWGCDVRIGACVRAAPPPPGTDASGARIVGQMNFSLRHCERYTKNTKSNIFNSMNACNTNDTSFMCVVWFLRLCTFVLREFSCWKTMEGVSILLIVMKFVCSLRTLTTVFKFLDRLWFMSCFPGWESDPALNLLTPCVLRGLCVCMREREGGEREGGASPVKL